MGCPRRVCLNWFLASEEQAHWYPVLVQWVCVTLLEAFLSCSGISGIFSVCVCVCSGVHKK